MILHNSTVTYVHKSEQVNEATHWAIQLQEIAIPAPENEQIEDLKNGMQSLFHILFRIYVHTLITNDLNLSKIISKYFLKLTDPYIPNICTSTDIDNSYDTYFDDIDNEK